MGLLISLSTLLMVIYAAYREEAAQMPGDASPEFVTVTKLDKANGLIGYRVFCLRPVHETFIREQDGKQVKQTILRHVCEQQDCSVSMKEARVYDSKGWRLAHSVAWERLAVGAMVLKSADGKKLNPRYLRVVRDDALILVIPEREPAIIAEEPVPKAK